MPYSHTPVYVPVDASSVSMGTNNGVRDSCVNGSLTEVTVYPTFDPYFKFDATSTSNGIMLAATLTDNNTVFDNAGGSPQRRFATPSTFGVPAGTGRWWLEFEVLGFNDQCQFGIMQAPFGWGPTAGTAMYRDATNTRITKSGSNHDTTITAVVEAGKIFGLDFNSAAGTAVWYENGVVISHDAIGSLPTSGGDYLFFAQSSATGSIIKVRTHNLLRPSDQPSGSSLWKHTFTGTGNLGIINAVYRNQYMDGDNLTINSAGSFFTGGDSGGGGSIVSTVPMILGGSTDYQVEFTIDAIEASGGAENGFLIGLVFNPTASGGVGETKRSLQANGQKNDGTSQNLSYGGGSYGTSSAWTIGDTIGLYYKSSTDDMHFYLNGVDLGPAFTDISALLSTSNHAYPYSMYARDGEQVQLNCGQKPFKFPIANAVGVATHTMHSDAVSKSTNQFQPVAYEGTGAELAITSLSFSPGLVIIKNRDATDNWMIYDVVRGATKEWHPNSNLNAAETTTAQTLKSFDANGFTLGTDVEVNTDDEKYVALCWNAGSSSTISNAMTQTSNGNQTNVDRAVDTSTGLSIIKYTGTGSASTILHGLGKAPAMIWVKAMNKSSIAQMWHRSFSNLTRGYMVFAYNQSEDNLGNDNMWGPDPVAGGITSIGVGNHTYTNNTGDTYVAYCFSEVQGFSAFGKYLGSNDADGPYVELGFKPACLWLVKRTGSSFHMWDSARMTWNPAGGAAANGNAYPLSPNQNVSESTQGSGGNVDLLSNGFKVRSTWGDINGNENDILYMAWAESPFSNNTRSK